MEKLNFEHMVTRFGEVIAYECLEQIEIAAGISPRQMAGIDPETRLANALHAQDATNEVAA